LRIVAELPPNANESVIGFQDDFRLQSAEPELEERETDLEEAEIEEPD
jgi:hypothetical protein